MRYEILLAPQAVLDLKLLPARERAAVRDAMDLHLRHEPTRASRCRIKRLQGLSKPEHRLRIGDVRVSYDVTDGSVEILAVILKSSAGRWLQEEGERQ
jgi:mRNA-degrading endonuclease RelE of RelBE toxin-antitoxin system